MNQELLYLVITAATLGFIHTLLGPDHYLPFIVLSKSNNWSMGKTIKITLLCGIGHVGSSIIIGVIGIVLGWSVSNIELFEGFRGDISAWLLIGFGLAYCIYGCRKVYKNKQHTHFHKHENGVVHIHTHKHHHSHTHLHIENSSNKISPWVLFVIFVFGPCEVLVPLLMYPASKNSTFSIILIALIFSLATILTMLSSVLLSVYSLQKISLKGLEKYSHIIAGASIAMCGMGIIFLGL